jgi:hypothetical protein
VQTTGRTVIGLRAITVTASERCQVTYLELSIPLNEKGVSFASRTLGTRGNTTELVVSDTR